MVAAAVAVAVAVALCSNALVLCLLDNSIGGSSAVQMVTLCERRGDSQMLKSVL